jgi:hypothetical protein
MGPVVYGPLDQQYPWLDSLANHSNIGDSYGAMLQPKGDLEQQQFIKLRNKTTDKTRRPDDPLNVAAPVGGAQLCVSNTSLLLGFILLKITDNFARKLTRRRSSSSNSNTLLAFKPLWI